MQTFVNVILPLALPEFYTYSIDDGLIDSITPGVRVVVQFGKQRVYTALVHSVHHNEPVGYEIKPVLSVVDEAPIVNAQQLKLWQWMADYYLCTLGEVMAAALPSAFKLQSETTITLHPDFKEEDESLLSEREYLIVFALKSKKKLRINELTKIISLKQVMPVVKTMLAKNIIEIEEELLEKYKPRIITYVKLSDAINNEESLQQLMSQLEKRAVKQLDLLMRFLQLSQEHEQTSFSRSYLLKKANMTSSVLQQLVKKNVFELFDKNIDRIEAVDESHLLQPAVLNALQQTAFAEIKTAFAENKVCLLHGVTSSGKTEIFIHLIEQQAKINKQVLYLLPEIALTTQIIIRLQKHFGNKLLVYHSRFNEQERVEVWNKVLEFQQQSELNKNSFQLIVGARSALFLPFSNLGLVIVDEEHDTSYKQIDPAPRYHARDTAILLATQNNANVILASATPSLESYYNAIAEKYKLINLNKRHADLPMPPIKLIDIREAMKRKLMHSHFSDVLFNTIKQTLEQKEQVILFQNRRGFVPVFECKNCSWVPHCVNCDVSLTYHKREQVLRCHYCGYSIQPPRQCAACGSTDLRMKGFGTEKVEEELQVFYPDKKIARMDHDSTKSKHAYRNLITDFQQGEIDILVGTQMVTKGLDFDNVGLVGILNADSLLNYPDFRAYERSFQLMVQVSGRAGRKNDSGHVLIQTYNPSNRVLAHVLDHHYKNFYNEELIERHQYNYPPYFRLIELRLKHRNEYDLEKMADAFTRELKEVFGKRVYGPTHPPVGKVKNQFIRVVMLKLEKKLSADMVKKKLNKALDFFKALPENRQLIIQVDVDPQ